MNNKEIVDHIVYWCWDKSSVEVALEVIRLKDAQVESFIERNVVDCSHGNKAFNCDACDFEIDLVRKEVI